MKKVLFAILLVFATASLAQDVDSYIELLRSDIKTEKMDYITEVMEFRDEEATAFWPVYREYQFELDKLGDKYLAVIKDYAANYDSLSGEKATELTETAIKIKKERLDLRKKYFKEFSKVLSPVKAARWVQLENEVGLLVELQMVSEIPFAKLPDED
jgi:hypothetical protein